MGQGAKAVRSPRAIGPGEGDSWFGAANDEQREMRKKQSSGEESNSCSFREHN